MNTFEFKDGKLYRNGKQTFVASGEVQYFRIDRKHWDKMLTLLEEANCNCVSTYIPWNWHEISEGEFDFSGKTHPSRDLISFLDMVQQRGLMLIVKPGPFVHNEMQNGGIPIWLTENHREILALGPDGELSQYQSYPPLNYLHPLTMQYVQKWYKACAPILGKYDNIILWQIDNETSYSYTFMDGTGLLNDYHPLIINKGWFQKFLRSEFKTINDLNARYKVNYTDFGEVFPPKTPPKDNLETLRVYDWIHFKEWLGVRYLKACCDILYDLDVKGPFILNAPFHGFFSLWRELVQSFDNEKYRVFITHCDYPGPVNETSVGAITERTEFCKSCQTDFHGNNEIQACNVSQRWGLFGTSYDLLFKLVVGNGLKMINYYWFCDGENFLDYGEYSKYHEYHAPVTKEGKKRPHYFTIKAINAFFVNHPEFMDYKKVYHVSLGYLHQYHRMSIFRNTLNFNIIREMDDLTNLLTLSNITFKVVSLNELENEETGVLIVPTAPFMPVKVQNDLLNYAFNGNHLILIRNIPELDENLNKTTCFQKALNIRNTFTIKRKRGWEEPQKVNLLGLEIPVYDRVQSYEVEAETIGTIEDKCCAFTQGYGKGKITVIGFKLSYFMDLHKELICKLLGKQNDTDLVHWELRNNGNRLITMMNIFAEKRKANINGKNITIPAKTAIFGHINKKGFDIFR